jgi:hypothetical protein
MHLKLLSKLQIFQAAMCIRYNEFDFFLKIKNTDPLTGAKFKPKTHLIDMFLDFGTAFCAFGFKV